MLRVLFAVCFCALGVLAEDAAQPTASSPSTTASSAKEDVFQLDQIIVTGTKVEKTLRDVPGSINLVEKDKIKSAEINNTSESISNVPGVDLGSQGMFSQAQTVSLRGNTSEGTLVLLDGIPLNSGYKGYVDLSSLLTDNVDRIEIFKGPASSIYGANAAGGVINIITKSKVTKPEIGLSYGYGSFNTHDGKLSYADKLGPLSLNLAGSYQYSDGERANTKHDARDINGTINFPGSENFSAKINAGYFKAEDGAPGSTVVPSLDDKQSSERLYAFGETKLGVTPESFIKIKLKGQKDVLDFVDTVNGNTASTEQNYDTEAEYTYDLGGINVLTLGGRLNYDVLNNTGIGEPNATTKSGYIMDTFDLLGSWILTASARYDSHSIYGDNFNPSAGLIYNIDDNLQFKASIGSAYRAPTFSDLYWPTDAYSIGNPLLKPEKTFSYDAGINIESDLLLVKVSYFKNTITDLIQWAPVNILNPFGQWTPSNVTNVDIYGVESEARFVPAENFNAYLAYTWMSAKDTIMDTDLFYRPRNKVNLGLEYKLFGQRLNLDSEYYDIRTAASGAIMPAFIKTDVKLTSTVTKEVNIVVAVKNLEDVKYELREGYPMPGRSFTAGTDIRF